MDGLDAVMEACFGMAEVDAFQFARRGYPSTEGIEIDSLMATVLC